MSRALLVALGACLWLSACATKRLPPGTPPPEYETRAIPPWPPVSASAPAPAPASSVSEVSLDAGSSPDAASETGPSPDAGSE
jgi:hypothetical protein